MKKKIISVFLVLILVLGFTSCKDKNVVDEINKEVEKNQLQIFKTDLKLTQDQVLSQIKAEYLKENKGYLDSDEVKVLVTLKSDALIDLYNLSNTNLSVAEYVSSEKGQKALSKINEKQTNLIKELEELNLINDVEYQYSTIMNAIAVKTTYGNFKKIGKLDNVEDTILSDTFNRPQESESTSDVSKIINDVDVYETGIFNSSSVTFTGEGTAVAVLDSGFDCSHSVFAKQPDNLMITRQDVSKVLFDTNAASFTKNIELTDVYYSDKIPFVYDYADKDDDVFPYDSEHGTHVAGIIGGCDETITGVAVNTQLVLLKVFPDLNDGAETEDILAALEDAVLLGVDAINLSLGSSCGFAREEDGSKINEVYDKINDSGISLLTAASNSYSAGYGGEQGNTNKVTNPDSGTVGSPSTYAASLSVASISGTKSKYILGNNSQVFFFHESNSVTAEENNFIEELGLKEGETKTYEYVTVPGVGLKVNYTSIDVKGKIALVRRGDNTFEEKAQNAKNAGAIACIIYNNVEGDIIMSMGKTDHIPTISISKEDGTKLAAQDNGTLTISNNFQAGPFMSDFSSWGPTPSLGLKPEITAHGGNILSAIPGGGYDELSGTSMATPNLCGIVVLIRQYLKEAYPTKSAKEISILANQLLMSTATIVVNQKGNPYSPRKQGAGLASLYNAVNTSAYITVDGIDRSKLELLDDPDRTGIYEMEFNVENLTNKAHSYNLSVVGMTESVSTSDPTYVSEFSQILGGTTKVEVISGGSINGNTVTVNSSDTLKLKVTYTLSEQDKNLIDSLFAYGMYIEGFVKLESIEENEIDLNVPFLAFYGDWTEAPMFDKTYYEVESEAHNDAIDEEDKLKADYYATTPYGSYFYNYIIPLGTYLYDIDTEKYDKIPATEDHIAISNILGTIDGFATVYSGLLRNAKTMNYTIVDKVTGEVVWELLDYNAQKAYSNGGTAIPHFNYIDLATTDLGLVNNRQYEFKMVGALDYKNNGLETNARNSFNFDFYMDDEAPVIKEVSYEKIYDKTLKKDRYYVTMIIYDNHYVQSISPLIFTSSSSYTLLTENPIPVYSEFRSDNKVRFEITDYLDDIYADELITSALAFSVDDYALNSNIYLCQLPGTKGDFKFTKDGTKEASDLVILSLYQDEIVDLTRYLYTSDLSVDENKDYLKHLTWTSSNEKIAKVKNGQVACLAPGRVTITVQEQMDLKQAVLILNIKDRPTSNEINESIGNIGSLADSSIKEVRFSYFDTLFAYSRAAQTSLIGATGDRRFLNAIPSLSFYPGEKIQLFHEFDPWYYEDKYNLSYSSSNESVAVVDENGVVTGLKEGTTNIVLSVEGSNLKARVRITIKNEFVIENRTLIAYKGLGGTVEIPDDEGILYIGSFAFCLYETDQSMELPEDDYDANKIPSANTTIKKVIVPEGIEEIQKYAFYNCSGLEEVILPDSIKYIRDYAFYGDINLESINLANTILIGRSAFQNCEKIRDLDLKKVYAIGVSAFEGCSSLVSADLTALRNTGQRTFKDCTSLKNVTLNENTKLANAMFVNSGIETIDIYEKIQIPSFAFAKCANLKTVNIHNDFVSIGTGAFSECTVLEDVNILGEVGLIGSQAFYASPNIKEFTLPNCEVEIGEYAFYQASGLEELVFQKDTKLKNVYGSLFAETNLTKFTVDENNPHYSNVENLLVNKDENTIIFAAVGHNFGDFVLDSKYTTINDSAFSGAKITSLTITNSNTIIGEAAFKGCKELKTINLPAFTGVEIKKEAFRSTEALEEVNNLKYVIKVGEYAFAESNVRNAEISINAKYEEGVFFQSKIEEVTIGEGANFGLGVFQNCLNLKTVNMPEGGNVHFGEACFAYDIQLEKIDLSKVDSIIEDETFYGCSLLKIANLVNVEYIGDYAFADCSSLNYLNVPKVIKIGEGAFSKYDTNAGAPQISDFTLPDTLTYVGDGAFLGCEGIVDIVFPESVEYMGDYLFAYCINLTTVKLPKNIKTIGLYSFANCELLTLINLDNIETIKDYAFTSCKSLEKTNLSNVKTIGFGSFASSSLSGEYILTNLECVDSYAFQNTFITKLEAKNLITIKDAAFADMDKISSFLLNDKIEYLGTMAFNGSDSLEKLYFIKDNEECVSGKVNNYLLLDNGCAYVTLPSNTFELRAIPSAYNVETIQILEGTSRIDLYAGNCNKYIKKIILPGSLQLIGNYAFYGYDNLKEVEFKSFTAPLLEDYYNADSVLPETAPGFDKLHNQFDLFGYELYYYNFKDLIGVNDPILMTVPANDGLIGYDNLLFEVYFGKLSEAKRSNEYTMDKNMVDFISFAKKIKTLNVITLADERLINDALTAYNGVKQNPADFNINIDEWNDYVSCVTDAKVILSALKLSKASKEVQNLQVKINQLPDKFDISMLETLKTISNEINKTKQNEKSLLDLTKYNQLVSSYNEYVKNISAEIEPVIGSVNNTLVFVNIATTASIATLAFVILKRRWL